MIAQSLDLASTFRMMLRVALLVLALFAPMIAMQSVEASSETLIGDIHDNPSGIGLVLVVSLQRG